MLIIDVTVVNVALPSIGKDLGLDRAAMTWVAIAYTLLFGSLLLLGGRLADTFGRRRIFLAGIGLFTAASAASGLAPDGNILIFSRALQGIGAALMSPAALSIITTTFQDPIATARSGSGPRSAAEAPRSASSSEASSPPVRAGNGSSSSTSRSELLSRSE